MASIDIDHFVSNPNDSNEVGKINRLVAIFTNFSSNDGQELKRLFSVFQKWARSSTHVGTTKNRAADMMQFIGQKIEEMDLYKIEPQAEQNSKVEKIQTIHNETVFGDKVVSSGSKAKINTGARASEKNENFWIKYFLPVVVGLIALAGLIIAYLQYIK